MEKSKKRKETIHVSFFMVKQSVFEESMGMGIPGSSDIYFL